MPDDAGPEGNGFELVVPEPNEDSGRDESSSTVGTGSVLGLGCLAIVVALVLLAIAFRLLGGRW